MTAAKLDDAGSVLDAGPLLCYGAVPNGPRIVWRHLNPMSAPRAVRAELEAIGRFKDRLGNAAAVWLGTKGGGLQIVDLDDSQRSTASQIQGTLHSRSKKESVTAQSDLGEAEAIALALANGLLLATNDFDASAVASAHSVPVVTVAEMLRSDMESGIVDLAETRTLVNRMRDAGCDIGENISGPLDLRRPQRPVR